MNPSELIYFSIIGVGALLIILLIWLILRKHKKVAAAATVLIIMIYVGYALYFPKQKMVEHEARYEQLEDHLAKKYPDRQFLIRSKQYEEGMPVGDYDVNDVNETDYGVILSVDSDGNVAQKGSWSAAGYPERVELWRELAYVTGEPYTLDSHIPFITKQDEWTEGELTAFALQVDGKPAVAVFTYSKEGYGLLSFEQGESRGFAAVEESGYLFIYADKQYPADTVKVTLQNGETFARLLDETGLLVDDL